MKNDTKLVEQKSMLAKLMTAENITVEHKKIPTAAFDVKNRVLYLPILKWKPGSDVYDLFCAHEVGHALWTPYEGWHSSASKKGKGFKSFLNVVEDARIEKKIKRKFAGARSHMIGGYKELMNEDFFGLRKMGVDPNDLGLIDRINLYTKAGTDYGIEFSEEEKDWVEKVMRTETFEDVLEVTEALYEYCKENESETDNSYDEFGDMDESDEFGEDEDSEGSDGSGDDSDMDDFNMDMEITMAGVGLLTVCPFADSKGSYMTSFRQAFLKYIIKSAGLTAIPEYWNAQTKVVYNIDNQNKLILNGVGGADYIKIEGENRPDLKGAENVEHTGSQYTVGATYKSLFSKSGYFLISLGRSSTIWVSDVYKYDDDKKVEKMD